MNKLLSIIVICYFVVGCGDKVINNDSPRETINISSDSTLSESSTNVQYVIDEDGVIFDLGAKTIKVDGDYQAIIVKGSNVVVKNGAVRGTGFETGIQIASCIKPSDIQPLNDKGQSYESEIYKRCNHSLIVEAIHFEDLRTGIYISDYIQKSTINNNIFKNIDRMGIYLSPGVTKTNVTHNKFLDNGYRDVEEFGRPRGSISIDSAYGNNIDNNYFNSSPKWVVRTLASDYRVPEIEFYRNCGEPTFNGEPVPRIHGADDNRLQNNTFENVGLVAWFKYRDHHQLSNCVGNYPDQANNNSITGSTLINIKQFVIDEGVNNKW